MEIRNCSIIRDGNFNDFLRTSVFAWRNTDKKAPGDLYVKRLESAWFVTITLWQQQLKATYTHEITHITEITKGIVNAFKHKMDESILLAIIFFIGHVLIAMVVVSLVTGASIWEAGAVALIEPAVNSVWFYVLHKLWKKFK